MIKLLIGGSPCTFWSIAQKNNRETEAEGIGWELFKNYLVAKEKFKPDFFLYENNKSTAQAIKDQIKKELKVYDETMFMQDSGVRYIEINSALVSAQNRQRFYVHNCGEIEQPEDRGILLRDILESGVTDREKARAVIGSSGRTTEREYFMTHQGNMCAEPVRVGALPRPNGELYCGTIDKPIYEVKGGMITIKGKQYPIKLVDGFYIIRKPTVTECARLQTMPDDYCRAVSDSQAYKGLGNGWTAEVIIHILNGALKDIPRDEEIVVLSMYDGIGTGRYCLDKMGFTNVKYYAYEIDKCAKQIAMSNYPDIIQMGDAFQLRHPDWTIGYSDQVIPETFGQYTGLTDKNGTKQNIKVVGNIHDNPELLEVSE